jgi:hypothetical protein
MREREALRRYRWELGGAFALYAAVLFGSIYLAESMAPGIARTLLALTPAIPIALAVWVIVRQFQRMDEFVRLRSLENIAIAAAITAAWTFTYGFFEGAGFPRLSMFWVWPVMGATWFVLSIGRAVCCR